VPPCVGRRGLSESQKFLVAQVSPGQPAHNLQELLQMLFVNPTPFFVLPLHFVDLFKHSLAIPVHGFK
jgi:hypothetical protein